MTEYATAKQAKFMEQLGLTPISADLTKQEARQMISDKLEKNGMSKTEAKVTPEAEENLGSPVETVKIEGKTHLTPEQFNKSGKEYHLSPEEVKCRALEAALQWLRIDNIEELMKQADKFVEWIYDK